MRPSCQATNEAEHFAATWQRSSLSQLSGGGMKLIEPTIIQNGNDHCTSLASKKTNYIQTLYASEAGMR